MRRPTEPPERTALSSHSRATVASKTPNKPQARRLRNAPLLAFWAYLLALAIACAAYSGVTERDQAAPHIAQAGQSAGRSRSVTSVIRHVFGRYGSQALRVSWCESRWHTSARNGQYLGLFQMGSWERARYGHGSGAWAQARAAHRYFVASGRDWSPWTCKP